MDGEKMVNSHFVPQFILRNFCADEKIQYYNLENKKAEERSTRSVYSEKGYYPINIEKSLCQKIEVQFANILNKKILNENYRISLNSKEMLILKKYLIITMLRVRDDNLEHNIWYHELKRSGIIVEDDLEKEFFSGDFYENINKVLECDDLDKLLDLVKKGDNLNLVTFIKDAVYSYNVFVRSNHSKEDFLIPDRGWAGYRGPVGVKKLNAMLNMPAFMFDPYVQMIWFMSSPQDYAIYPLSKSLALLAVSSAFKICLPGSPYKFIYPDEAPSLSACLGFGNANTIALPENQIKRDDTKEYRYQIKQLTKKDMAFLNGVLIKNADKYVCYADLGRVTYSLKENNT